MATPETKTPQAEQTEKHPLLCLPAGVNNLFLDCARCATDGGEPAYYRWLREDKQRRAAMSSPTPSTPSDKEAPRA